MAAGALFNLSLDKQLYKHMSADIKSKLKAIRDEQTLRATQRRTQTAEKRPTLTATRLTAKTPVHVHWDTQSMRATPPCSQLDMELSVILP
eukprot:2136209-Pyramimonas_sp.AAC.1